MIYCFNFKYEDKISHNADIMNKRNKNNDI